MKITCTIIFTLVLLGCSFMQPQNDSALINTDIKKINLEHPDNTAEKVETANHPLVKLMGLDDETKRMSELPSLTSLLLKRNEYCQLKKEEQSQKIEMLEQQGTAVANLELLLISSCKPQMTPGIMRNALAALKKDKELPDEFHSFFAIMIAQLNASDSLAKQQQELIERLNRTVEELTKIERDIESRDNQINDVEPFSV